MLREKQRSLEYESNALKTGYYPMIFVNGGYDYTEKQAGAMGFSDTFLIVAVCMICVLQLLIIMKRIHNGAKEAPH